MPRRPGPDPSQQPAGKAAPRPGDDGPLAQAIRAVPVPQPPPPRPRHPAALSDAELLARPWRAEAGHVGNWPQGAVIPAGVISDPAWCRELLARGFISAIEDGV